MLGSWRRMAAMTCAQLPDVSMEQHPKVTVAWAVASLENAMARLGNTPAEERTRRQFHQLLLALERDGYAFPDPRDLQPRRPAARILPMRPRGSARPTRPPRML